MPALSKLGDRGESKPSPYGRAAMASPLAHCLRVAAATRSGRFKDNEDAYGYRSNPFGRIDLAVVDGAGRARGRSIGGFSNSLVHESLRLLLLYGDPARSLKLLEGSRAPGQDDGERAAILLATARGDVVRIAWKGDVCAWRIDSCQERITRLNSPHREERGALTRWVGADSKGDVEARVTTLAPGELLLIATDGVFPDIDQARLPERKAKTLSGFADSLVACAPGHDDSTAVVLRNYYAENDTLSKREGSAR